MTCEVVVAEDIEARFERYCEVMVEALSHADRRQPACWYLKGLLLPGGRKSVEPMAARVHPQDVPSAHQSMHHLVADSDWSDARLLAAVAGQVVPALVAGDAPCFWIIDDTGIPKKGEHSVGVARQYCGQPGKTGNCQVAVSLSLASARGSLPVGYRLYLPRAWAEDRRRRDKARVPAGIGFATKGEIATAQIEAALAAELPRGVVLADAAYGDEAAWRDGLSAQGLTYAVGVRPQSAVWWGEYQPARPAATRRPGRPRTRLLRDPAHPPVTVRELALALPTRSLRTLTWREGVAGRLCSRFARARVRPAQGNRARPEQWLLMEWPRGAPEPTRYWLSTLPADTSFRQLVATVKARWMIERDCLELSQEIGLGHFEGRSWKGFHHHASLCIAAYGFLMRERIAHGGKKNYARFKEPPVPQGFRPRGAATDAAAYPLVHRHPALPAGTSDRARPASVPLLWPAQRFEEVYFLTQ